MLDNAKNVSISAANSYTTRTRRYQLQIVIQPSFHFLKVNIYFKNIQEELGLFFLVKYESGSFDEYISRNKTRVTMTMSGT